MSIEEVRRFQDPDVARRYIALIILRDPVKEFLTTTIYLA